MAWGPTTAMAERFLCQLCPEMILILSQNQTWPHNQHPTKTNKTVVSPPADFACWWFIRFFSTDCYFKRWAIGGTPLLAEQNINFEGQGSSYKLDSEQEPSLLEVTPFFLLFWSQLLFVHHSHPHPLTCGFQRASPWWSSTLVAALCSPCTSTPWDRKGSLARMKGFAYGTVVRHSLQYFLHLFKII